MPTIAEHLDGVEQDSVDVDNAVNENPPDEQTIAAKTSSIRVRINAIRVLLGIPQ